MGSILSNHYVRLFGEAALAGIVAFGITYQATGNVQAALIAAILAAMNKGAPQVTGNAVGSGTPTAVTVPVTVVPVSTPPSNTPTRPK